MNNILADYRRFLLLCLIGFTGFFCSYMRIPVLPLFAASLGAGPAQVGLINGSFMLATGVLSIPGGLLADRLGRRLLVIGGLVALAVSSFLVAQCNAAWQMVAIYLLFGAGIAGFAPSMLSQVAEAIPPARLGQAYGWYTTAIYVAMTVGPATGGVLARALGLRQVFLVSGGLLVVVALFALSLLPAGATGHKTDSHGLIAATADLLHNRRLLACLVATFGSCIGFGTFLSFLPLYAAGKQLDPARVGLVFAAQALTNVVCRIPVGMLADRVSRSSLVVAGLVIFAAGISAVGACTGFASLIASALLLGTGMALSFTAIGALVAEAVPALRRGLAMGMYNSCIYLGMMAGSAAFGVVIRTVGYPAAFAGGGVTALIAMAIFLFLLHGG